MCVCVCVCVCDRVLCYAPNERVCRDTFSSLVRLAREDSSRVHEQYNDDRGSEREVCRYTDATYTCIDTYTEHSTSRNRQRELES